MNAEIVAAIDAWERAEKNRQEAIDAEINARAYLLTLAMPTPTFGTNRAQIGDGREIKAVFDRKYKVLKGPAFDAAIKVLPRAVRDALIKYDPVLSVSAYKALEPAHQAVMNDVIEISNQRPRVEIVTPKPS